MKKIIISLLAFCFICLFTSCATILSGTKAKITVSTSTGEPANATVDGMSYYIKGPTVVEIRRGYQKSTIVAENDDSKGTAVVRKTFNFVTLGNIILGGIPGLAVDGVTGALTKPAKKSYIVNMMPKIPQPAPQVEVNQEPIVEQVKNNVTNEIDLNNTIIRWDIQSRPQGADIFWRVVSKTPEVKSTNNKYLTTTPYEATKALDIRGLTLQNSGNVRIILRCEKEGYLQQEKEYDVRMIIDQEEISAFFRLVKEQ